MNKMQLGCLALILSLGLPLSGCHSLLSKIHVVDVQQGNQIKPAQIKRLKKGMTQQQVKALLGAPVYHNMFNANQLDYVSTWQKARQNRQTKILSIYFNNDKMSHYTLHDYQEK